MTAPLLTTKLNIPPPRPNMIPRPRLVERLDEGLRLGHTLTLVSAPAGFGKTTLLSAWARSLEPRVPAVWVSLDEEDSDPFQFATYLVAALRALPACTDRRPPLGESFLSELRSPQRVSSSDVFPVDEQVAVLTPGESHRGLDRGPADGGPVDARARGRRSVHRYLCRRRSVRTRLPGRGGLGAAAE
jgi:hypothetical protein